MADSNIGGGLSTFIPTFSPATGQVQVEFTRNVKNFAVNRYTKLIPISTVAGSYLKIQSDEALRVVNEADFRWAYGEDRPTGVNNDFDFVPFQTQRFERGFHIPYETAKVASWEIVAQHARSRAAQMMTLRTNRALSVLTTSGNWGGNYSATGTAFGSGPSYTNCNIQKLFQTAIEKVAIATGGVVGPSDLIAVMGPKTAFKMSQSAELKELIKYTQGVQLLQGAGKLSRYGLAPGLFGIGDIVIEDAVKVTSQKGATRAADYMLGTDAVLFVSRPGGLTGAEGEANFATVTNFVFEDMTVESFDDPKNRRTQGSIVDNNKFEMTAPLAGWYIADIAS